MVPMRPVSLLPRPAAAGLPTLLALLLLGGCFDPPVSETLHLEFLPEGGAVVKSVVEIAGPEDGTGEEGNPQLARRLFDLRREYEQGLDPWTARFASLRPLAEKHSWEKRLGAIRRVERSATVASPEEITSFFFDTGLRVSFTVGNGMADLALLPGASTRATRRQQRDMDGVLDDWSEKVSAYLAASEELYRYLERAPERAAPCLGWLFSEFVPDEERAGLPEPSEGEQILLDRLGETMPEVWGVLRVPEGSELSLDEVSRRVYDPFPASLTVSLPAEPLLVEGFEGGGTRWKVHHPSLWEAFRALEGRWLAPDLAQLYVAHASNEKPLHLQDLAGRARTAAPAPSGREVRLALEERLRVEPSYRAVWRVAGQG